MDPSSLLEQYTQDLSNLPNELHYLLEELKEKDLRLYEIKKSIRKKDAQLHKYIKDHGSLVKHPKEDSLYSKMKSDFDKSKKLQEEKILLSNTALFLISKHFTKLQNDVEKLERSGVVPPIISAVEDEDQEASLSDALANLNPKGTGSNTPDASLVNTHTNSHNHSHSAARNRGRANRGRGGTPIAHGHHHSGSHNALPNGTGSGLTISISNPNSRGGSAGASATPGASGPANGTPGSTGLETVAGSTRTGSSVVSSSGTGSADRSRSATPGGGSTSTGNRKKVKSENELSIGDTVTGNNALTASGSGTNPNVGSTKLTLGLRATDLDHAMPLNTLHIPATSGMVGVEEDGELYCFCQQVSYGNMVACDNSDCKYEWFHYDCVGLKEPPQGIWYCPDCRKGMETLNANKKNRRKRN
ncbi:hypothetical protein BVG19_g3630 [[Candida] boidinii]|nr:hypothetical protein BVG19_g3630 [[Candida] boidinii]OWB52355.1 hypothetical protein B5S27_g3929 [[Candida] boidinii]